MRPGTAKQLAWGPVGGARDVGPPGVARRTPHKADHLTERETKAQTPMQLKPSHWFPRNQGT